jgi:hypothetical protein
VAKVRAEMEMAGDVETVTTSIDTKGCKQPARTKSNRAKLEAKRNEQATREFWAKWERDSQELDRAYMAGEITEEQYIAGKLPEPTTKAGQT